MNYSASFFEDEEEPSKLEAWLQNRFGEKINEYLMQISMIIGVVFGVGMFILLPNFITSLFVDVTQKFIYNIIEGLVRILIFISYIYFISKLKDIYRVFQYHGAEHKVISCHEYGEELTVGNVKKHPRLHPRCGTSFLFLVMLISIIVFSFIPKMDKLWLQMVFRVLLVPLIAGLSYEMIKLAGTYENSILKLLSYPGMTLQRMTTQEPDEDQIEVAIAAMKGVLENEEHL